MERNWARAAWLGGVWRRSFGGGEGLEGFGQGEGLVEEEAEGDDFGAGVVGGAVGEVAVGGLEDEGWEGWIFGAELDG